MRSATGAPGSPAAEHAGRVPGRARVPTRLAVAGIGISILIMIATSLARNSWMYPSMVMPSFGPPFDLQSLRIGVDMATVLLWIAIIAGGLGVIAGLTAVQRGARPSVRALLIAAAVAVTILTVLPPAGSTDAFDYAAYGRIMVLGHSPYVTTPQALRLMHNSFTRSVPFDWQNYVSVYGPLASFEQFLAAKLGGLSAARVTFWLKLWNAVGFGVVALVVDRVLRSDPAQRLRAHLLWTINPLLLWDLVAMGHVDLLAAAAGLLGLVVLGKHSETARPPLLRVLGAGVLIGAAADIKINFVLFGLGLAWVLRRSLTGLATAAAGALLVLVPSYAWFGMPAVRALFSRRNGISADSFYHDFLLASWRPHLAEIALVLIIAMAILAFWRMPAGDRSRPVVRAALVLSVAWSFFWPYQFPWYDAMIIVLLIFYPATRLDWLVAGRLAVATLPNVPGNPFGPPGHVIYVLHHYTVDVIAPLALMAAAAGLVGLCLSGLWAPREPGGPPGTSPEEPELVPSAASLAARHLRWRSPLPLGRASGQGRSPAARSR
jgi:hypothetical protein